MITNILELVAREKSNGYSEINANAKVCQDLVLKAIAESPLNRNVTIKGGVVMRCKTKNIRRATQDLDIDFIKYPITNEAIDLFLHSIDCVDGIHFFRIGDIEELNQQDYRGKRVILKICDSLGHELKSKIDLGVHNKLEIEQEEFYFDVAMSDESVCLLINSSEQMFTEKLRSLLKFGSASTRYKDIFDMYFLISKIKPDSLKLCFNTLIFQDSIMREKNINDIISRLKMTFNDNIYRHKISTSDKNWLNIDIEIVFNTILSYLNSL